MNFYVVLFVVLGTTLPREVSSEESCSVPGDEDFESRREDCYNILSNQGDKMFVFAESTISICNDSLSYDQYGNPLPPSSKDPGHYILFVFLDSLPVLILVPLILFFNINLASGTGHSIVFSTQVLLAFFSIDQNNIIWQLVMMIPGLLVFFSTPLWILWPFPSLTHIALGYVKVVLAVVIVVVYLRVATASQCPVQCCRGCWARLRRGMRHWREAHLAQRPLFTGACSVAILIYGSLLDVSFRLIRTGYRLDSVCIQRSYYDFTNITTLMCYNTFYTVSNPNICWGSLSHLPYLIPAFVIVFLSLLPPLLFFYHPGVPALVSFITKGRLQLPRLPKIKPLLDVFQGVYRPKMQFFAGLHLIYRVVLWCVVAFNIDGMPIGPSVQSEKIQIFLVVWLLILGIQGLFMPFESRRHNYLESLIMISVSVSISTHELPILYGYLFSYAPTNLPLICVVVYYIYKLVRFCCCRRRQNYQEIPEEQEDIEENFQGERWQPPDDALLN